MTTQPQAPRRSEGSSPRCGQPGRLGRVVRMRLTVLGGCGAWPAAGQACSGYLVEDDGFRLLLDPGYAVVPRLLQRVDAAEVDAVLVSHGHPDHCADLHPLLRARAFRQEPAPALAVPALPGAVDRGLGLDGPGARRGAVAG